MQFLKRVQSALFGRGLSVKLDTLNLLKTTLSAQYLPRGRRIVYRRRKVGGVRESNSSETDLSWGRGGNQIGDNG
jgi:hypothetical protein